MEAADKNIPLNLNAIDGKRQSMEWQMLTLTMSNQLNQAASLLK